ncbi:hypothetical protein [Streptomyces marianii]|uniref:Uncharacterized protein n=1 Tax=Streptomyces marianii TaxID=1817406 RepID=A0A5R9DRQ2_9ACTN|nr:hypothetical protein [Streptomyces marianii]TLQ39270.1 hypothetical protein FEF34_38400 [Streptomyces marianii]
MSFVLALVLGMTFGYVLRCWRPARRAVRWAQRQESGTARWWMSQPVLALAVAALYVRHPRRSWRNALSWQEDHRAQVPQFDPDWAAKRSSLRPGPDGG